MTVSEAPTAPCTISTWSADGFGHQLLAALSCRALAMVENSTYRYRASRHTELEHGPADEAVLLTMLHEDHEEPLTVKPAPYFKNCNGLRPTGMPVFHGNTNPPARPKCVPGQNVVCDNCFNMVDFSKEFVVHQRLAQDLRAQLRRHNTGSGGGGGHHARRWQECSRRADVCVHFRVPHVVHSGNFTSRAQHTTPMAELMNMKRRMFPHSWWRAAVALAAVVFGPPKT